MIKKTKKIYLAHKETIHNFIWRSLQIFGKQGITFLIFIFCAKILSPYDFGIYNYVLAIIFFLIIFGDFGISTATSKYVAEYNVTDKNKLKAVLFNSGIIILGLTILVTVLTLILGPLYLKEKYVYVLWLLPLIFLAPMTSLYDGIYRGLKKFKQLAIISLIIGIFSLSFVYISVKQYGLIGALIAQDLFYLILLIGLGLGYREFSFKWNKRVMNEIGKYSITFGIGVLGYYLFSRMGVIILGHYNYIEEIAVYELLNKIFIIILAPFTILGTVIAPSITSLFAKKKYELILIKFKRYLVLSIFSSVIVGILAYFLLHIVFFNFLPQYYGSIFIKMVIPVVLTYTLLIYGTTINFGLIIATGHAKFLTYSNVIIGCLNLIASIVLIKYVGYMGVVYPILFFHAIAIPLYHFLYFKDIKKLFLEERKYINSFVKVR